MENDIIIEKAKDNNWTCKVNIDGKCRYMYSKYNPIKKIGDISKGSNYIILGLGLGYELKQIAENTKGIIYVIDKDRAFYDLIINLQYLDEVISNPRIKFLFGDEYKNIIPFEINNYKIYSNENITQLHIEFYHKVIKYLNSGSSLNRKEKIAFYEHITIADDSIEALKNLGYDVVKMFFSTVDKMLQDVIKVCPDYIVSINLCEELAKVSKKLSIPYVSWTVDTPTYSLYGDLLENENVIAFIYDNSIVHKFLKKGFKNVFYMPVAANIKRLDNIKIGSNDIFKYSCDASFLGTTGIENEFNKYMSCFFSEETIEKLNNIFNYQLLNENEFIMKNLIDDELINTIEAETGYNITAETLLDKREKVAFLLGRKFNELQRISIVSELSKIFKFHVYGDERWSELDSHYIQYRGYAEHFGEMPKIFKCSKININYTRIYVESGLPMRVFDVLGSKGFLVTNYKEDIDKYFVNEKDLVIYRDTKDLIEIINYYLNNEKERQRIILNGYEKVKNEHTYEKRLKKIMKITYKYLNLDR